MKTIAATLCALALLAAAPAAQAAPSASAVRTAREVIANEAGACRTVRHVVRQAGYVGAREAFSEGKRFWKEVFAALYLECT